MAGTKEKPLTRSKAEHYYKSSRVGIPVSTVFALLGLLVGLLAPAIATIGWIFFGTSLFTSVGELVNMVFLRSKLREMLTVDREKAKYEHQWALDISHGAGLIAASVLPVALFAPAVATYAWIVFGTLACICIWSLIDMARRKSAN